MSADRAAPTPEARGARLSKEWCLAAAERESEGVEIGAGGMDSLAWLLTRARSALECYGRHHHWCDYLKPIPDGKIALPCNCGYEQAILDAESRPAREASSAPGDAMHDYCARCYHAKPCGNAECAERESEPICDYCGAEAIGHDEPGFPCKRTEADVVRAVLAKSRATVAALTAALERAAQTFDEYAALHEAKGTDEGRAKAAANRVHAVSARGALTAERGARGQGQQNSQQD